jgi:hypothetical protein
MSIPPFGSTAPTSCPSVRLILRSKRMDNSVQVQLFLTHADVLTDLLKREEGNISDYDLNLLKTKLNLLETRLRSIQTLRSLLDSRKAA